MFSKLRSRKSQRGAAALEFALVFPVLLLLLIGVVDFGVLMGAQTQVANAAREGARAVALTGLKAEGDTAAKAAIADMPGATKVGTGVTYTCTTAALAACDLTDGTSHTGSMVSVTVTYVHTWLSPMILGFLPTITLHGQSNMRIEA